MDRPTQADTTELDRFSEVFGLQYIPPEIIEDLRKSILRGSITWSWQEIEELPDDVIRDELTRLIAKTACNKKPIPYDIVRVSDEFSREADTESAILFFTADELKDFAEKVFQHGHDFCQQHHRKIFQDRMQRYKLAKKEVEELPSLSPVEGELKSKFKEILKTYLGQ